VSVTALAPLTDVVGWAALTDGQAAWVMKTADGGRTWQHAGPAAIPNVSRIDELAFLDEQHAFALATTPGHTIVMTTADGGPNWRQVLSLAWPAPSMQTALRGLVVADTAHAWVVAIPGPCDGDGCANDLRATADGGATWTTSYKPAGTMGGASFADPTHGWLSYSFGARQGREVLATNDGGRAWRVSLASARFEPTESISGLSGPTGSDVWIAAFDNASCTASLCSRYSLRASHDGGTTWSTVHALSDTSWWVKTGCGGFVGAPVFVTATHGVIPLAQGAGAGSTQNPGGLLVTDDGGGSFRCVRVIPDPSSIVVRFAGAKIGWARAETIDLKQTLAVSTDGGATWHVMTMPGR
jgi:hypothetical protein